MIKKSHRCATTLRLCLLSLTLTFSAAAVSQDDNISVEDAYDRIRDLGKRGSELFAIATPGETYNEISGSIGHSAIDMTLKGNGLLSFDVRRDFQSRPAEYPYDLATMSLNIPYISFEAGSQTIGPAMTCTKWESQGGKVFNGIKLNHLSGSTSLIHKMNVSPGARNLYPVSNQDTDAEYISHDNWLLDCFGNEYRVRSPSGVTYYFNANRGSEHFIRRRHTAGDELPDADLINYKFYVDRIERLNSQLKFFYSPVLPTNDPDNPWAPLPQNYRVRPPMHFEPQYKDTPDTGSIQTKKRLMRVELRAGNENSADSANTENQFIYFTYNATTELCPGLLKSVHSISTDVSKVWYEYDPLAPEHQRSQSAPHSRCLLKNVYRNAHSSPNVDERKRTWSFTYGAVGSPTPFFMPKSNGRGEWWQYHSKPVSHLPLHSVMTPTGATTTYEYRSGSVCEYQDSHDNYGPNPVSKCSGSSRAGTPFVTARTVAGDDVITQRSTIHYARIDDQYRVERKIQNAKTIKKLVFGRMNLTKLPSGKLIDEPKWHQYVDSNQLLRYELLDASNPNLKALVTVKHFYQEGLLFPKTKAIFTTGTNNAGYASWFKSRNMHMFNSRRINLIRTETEVDGITYETHYNGFDAFDNPTAIVEKHNDGSVASQRSIGLAYHNSTSSWNNYYVGSLKFKSTTSGTTLPLIESYGYNAQGQLATKRIAGFKTSYTYHYNGNLHQVIDGRNIDERRFNYKMGIAQNIVDRDGKQTTRVVDKYGRIRSETDPEGVKNTYTYNYNDFYNRVSSANVNPSGSYYKSRFYKHAQFTDSTDASTYRFDRETVYEKYLRATRYDALGRVIYTHERDITGPVQHRIQRFKYDNLGRLIFKGQVRKDWSTAHGTHYEYDNYGRIKNIRYPLANSPAIQYCHGPSCDGNFGAAGPVRDGYAIRDQLGYVTVRNYRAFGSPDNRELIEIRQEIRPVAFNDKQDDVVITSINRNKAGFITSVAQKGNSSGILTRAYEPYTVAGSMTFLVKSETHPEFGTKTVTQFDENGNTIKVNNFNGSQTTYVYDPMDRLRYALNPGSSGATAGVPTTEFRYRKNGTLEKAIQGNVTWEYGYNEINLLDEEKLTIDSETFVIKYDYDDFAQIKAITYPGVGTAPGRVVSYTNSGFGQAKSVTGFASKIEYHPTGIASLIDFENGTQFISTQDNYQRPSIWQTKSASGAHYQNFIYQYDLRSNVKKINNYFPPNGGSLTNLQYDGLNRLTRADASGVWGIAQFSYDPIGNIDKKYVGGHNRNYVYGVNNKLNSVTAANQPLSNYVMGYDGNGNVIATGVADYQFDQLNRLVRSDDGSAILDNTYDAHNMRVKGATTRNAQVSSTYYVYNRAGQLLHELDSETGETRDHIQLNGRTVATVGSHNFVDSDNDGMPDYFERQHGLSVFSNDAFLDDDKDGRSNLAEYLYDHLPTNADTDNDGIPDGQDEELPPFIPFLEQPGGVDLTPIYRYLLE